MTTQDLSTAVSDIQAGGDTILGILEAADPAVALPAQTAASILNLLAGIITKASTAFAAANGTPITDASIVADLTPDPTPLTPPTP